MKDMKTQERFIELRASGRSYTDISTELHVSKTTLVEWSKKLRREISNLRTIEMDALQRRLKLDEEARIEMFGVMLMRLKDEFAKRDLKEVSTDKLVDHIAKITSHVTEQTRSTRFSVKKGLLEEADHQFLNWPA